MRLRKAIIPILAIILLSSVAFGAQNTHLNVSLREVVQQNVTFAENFWLTQNRTYYLILGELNVTNPGTETIFDVELEFDYVEYMTSNFIYQSGRLGSQIRVPQVESWAEYQEVNTTWTPISNASSFLTTSSPSGINQDLDEDKNIDYISVNSTHLLFNISSDYAIIAIPLTNSTGGQVDISAAGTTPVTINITNQSITSLPAVGKTPIVYAYVTVLGTTNVDDTLESTLEINITDTAFENGVVHIPELQGGESTLFVYNISSVALNPPLSINTTYTHPNNRKVLAGESFTINDSVQNTIDIQQNVTLVNITMRALNVSWNGSIFNFTLHNLSNAAKTDWANVDNSSERVWSWNANGGVLGAGENANITYQVKAPDSVPNSGTYPAVRQWLNYYVDTAASNLTLVRADARADVNFTVDKRIVGPADNEQNKNVTWRSTPLLSTNLNITFTMTELSLWVTTSLDPNEKTSLTKNYTVDAEFNLSQDWTGGSSAPWNFNFTDGSGPNAPPPIIWIKPYWIISNNYNQIQNSSRTVNGTDVYVKYIYVINGYWLEVEKNVTDIGQGQYRINTWVHNKGNGWTPQGMTVTVYDFIPNNFVPFNFTTTANNQSNVTGEFSGTAYRWDVGLKLPKNASMAPDDGSPGGDDEWNVTYYVNGSGDYIVSDLYIVGLDPQLVDGASASPLISVIAAVSSHSTEVIFAGIVFLLVILNTVNLLMTNRINKKLDKAHGKEGNIRKDLEKLKKS